MSRIKRKRAAGDLRLVFRQRRRLSSATEGRSGSEDGADASLSSAVYSVELQNTSKAIIDPKTAI